MTEARHTPTRMIVEEYEDGGGHQLLVGTAIECYNKERRSYQPQHKIDWEHCIYSGDDAEGQQYEEANANARRLAACWNACHDAGLSTKALEEGVVQKLVAACTVAHDYEAIPCEEFERKYGPMGLDDVLAMLSAALTEARRGTP